MKKLTIQCAKDLAISKGGKCLSNEWINNSVKLTWKCEKSHQWEANYNNIKHGRWCPICYELEKRGKQRRLKEDIHKQVAAKNNGKCLTEIYKNNKNKLHWECDLGHRWFARLDAIKDQGGWCPQCRSNKNYYESQVRKVFEDIFKVGFKSIRPDFLKNPNTGFNLELDGYNEQLKIAFEYDGRTHYEEWDVRNPGRLQYVQKNDLLKNKLCELSNVTLFRIPYWESLNLRAYIENLVKDYVKKE